MAIHGTFLERLNNLLGDRNEAKLTPEGRIFYINHHTQTTSWLPPRENWDPGSGLPYGWELAVDRADKPYYINHVEKYTTREDPRDDPDYVEPPKPREVELIRDPNKGFGFVAGSEKPVIVRFVTEGGPSVDKLLPADQIIKINGEDVKKAPREYVIDLVRSCKHAINLTVSQPYVDNSSRKSALLTAAKKARLKSNPSRVRFADSVIVNGASVHGPSNQESYVPLMPNVLKVFLENGQTKSFKYDNKTTVKDVLISMQEKLNIQRIEHFALVLQNTKSISHGKLSILQEQETLAEIAARPGAMHFRCLFRVTFVPKDAYDLLREDTIAFEYFYMQCCNDVVQERFAAELKYDTALRLAALQIQQHAMSNNITNKISIKIIERDCGLEKFVPGNLLDSMKGKDIRKIIHQYLKMNQSLSAPGQKQLTALQAKLHYLKIISELKTFGSRIFMVTILDKKAEGMILVGPKSGVSLITNIKSYATAVLAEFEDIENLTVSKEGESMYRADVCLRDKDMEHVCLGLLKEDLNNFLALIEGYHRIFTQGSQTLLLNVPVKPSPTDTDTPPYEAKHKVVSSSWSYPEDIVSQIISPANGDLVENVCDDERIVDLSTAPPIYIDEGKPVIKISNNLDSTTSEDESTSTDEAPSVQANDLGRVRPLTRQLSSDDSDSSSRNNLNNFEEGVTSFGRVSTSSDTEIESLVQVHVNQNSRESSESDTISENSQVLPDEILLKTFTRYVPSPIASLHKRRKSGNLEEKHSIESDDVLQVRVDDNGYSVEELSEGGLDSSVSDTDTDSVFGGEAERKPLLSAEDTSVPVEYRNSPMSESDESVGETSEGSPSKQVEDTPRPATASSSGRLHLADLPQSFGLHSPDQLPRSEQDYQQMATSFGLHSPDQIPAEMYNAVYDPRLFCDGGLYLDPDIIEKVQALTAESSFPMQHFAQGDLPTELWLLFYMVNCYVSESSSPDEFRVVSPCDLTLIPPPKTPDDDLTIDFSNMANLPPPEFVDNGAETTAGSSTDSRTQLTREEIDRQFEDLCRLDEERTVGQRLSDSGVQEDESDSGNETISSENIELTNGLVDGLSEQSNITQSQHKIFNHLPRASALIDPGSDIDALIARFTVPPPPSSHSNNPAELNINLTKKQKARLQQDAFQYVNAPVNFDMSLEDEIESLIIPPPPSSPALIDIPIVPPVSMETSSKRGSRKQNLAHRRSNSVDLSLLRKTTSNLVTNESHVVISNESNRTERRYLSAETLASKINTEVDSPSTVSEKLTSLLKSIPFENVNFDQKSSSLTKTWSNRERRHSRESSTSVNSSTSTTSGSLLSRSSSLRVRRSLSPQPSHNSRETAPVSDRGRSRSMSETVNNVSSNNNKERVPRPILKSHSVGMVVHPESGKTVPERNSKSDTFAALKSKLQEYRDIMLRRKHSSAQKSQESSNTKGDKQSSKGQRKSSPVRRSSSLSESVQTNNTQDSVSPQSLPRKQQSLSLSHAPFETISKTRPPLCRSNNQSENYVGNGENHSETPEKKVPIKPLFNTLPVNFNKLSIRSLSSSHNRQDLDDESSGVEDLPVDKTVQVKKRGPLKALRAVFESHTTHQQNSPLGGEDKTSQGKTYPESKVSGDSHPQKSGYLTESTGKVSLSENASSEFRSRNTGRNEKLRAVSGDKYSPGIFEDSDFTTSSDVEEGVTDSQSVSEMKRNGDLMMWRPICRKSSTPAGSASNSDSSGSSSSHRRSASLGGDSRSRELSWSVPLDSENAVPGPQVRPPNGTIRPRNGPVHQNSIGYTFIKPKSTNFIKFVLSREYDSEKGMIQAGNDVECLAAELNQTMESLSESRIDKQPSQLMMCRDELVAVTLQFVTDAKCLVTSSTQSSAKLFNSVNSSIHTLAKMYLHCHATVLMMVNISKGRALSQELNRVADAYTKLMKSAEQVMDYPQTGNGISQLKKHATWLATLLGDLMKILASINLDR